MLHELKIAPRHFNDVISRLKKAEIRKDDRGFAVGHLVRLMEYHACMYTGRTFTVRITHILRAEDHPGVLVDGHVMFSFTPCGGGKDIF